MSEMYLHWMLVACQSNFSLRTVFGMAKMRLVDVSSWKTRRPPATTDGLDQCFLFVARWIWYDRHPLQDVTESTKLPAIQTKIHKPATLSQHCCNSRAIDN
eukprot:scaffold6265_cov193-Cylindrotheca_fusiformis.AAC.24